MMILRLLAALLISLLVIAAFVAVAYVTTEVNIPEEPTLTEEQERMIEGVGKELPPIHELQEETPEQQDLNDFVDEEIIIVEPEPFDETILSEPIETQGRYNGRW